MDVRCVMTGQNESGKSVIVRNTAVKPVSLALLPGYEFHRIWGSDSVPELPSDGTPPAQPNYFPPKSGFPSITWERIASRRRPAFSLENNCGNRWVKQFPSALELPCARVVGAASPSTA